MKVTLPVFFNFQMNSEMENTVSVQEEEAVLVDHNEVLVFVDLQGQFATHHLDATQVTEGD